MTGIKENPAVDGFLEIQKRIRNIGFQECESRLFAAALARFADNRDVGWGVASGDGFLLLIFFSRPNPSSKVNLQLGPNLTRVSQGRKKGDGEKALMIDNGRNWRSVEVLTSRFEATIIMKRTRMYLEIEERL